MNYFLKIEAFIETKCDTCNIELQQNMFTKHLKLNRHFFNFDEKTICKLCKKKYYNPQETHYCSKMKCEICIKIIMCEHLEAQNHSNEHTKNEDRRNSSN